MLHRLSELGSNFSFSTQILCQLQQQQLKTFALVLPFAEWITSLHTSAIGQDFSAEHQVPGKVEALASKNELGFFTFCFSLHSEFFSMWFSWFPRSAETIAIFTWRAEVSWASPCHIPGSLPQSCEADSRCYHAHFLDKDAERPAKGEWHTPNHTSCNGGARAIPQGSCLQIQWEFPALISQFHMYQAYPFSDPFLVPF